MFRYVTHFTKADVVVERQMRFIESKHFFREISPANKKAFLVGGSGKENIFEISVKEGNLVRRTQILENLLVSFRSISA